MEFDTLGFALIIFYIVFVFVFCAIVVKFKFFEVLGIESDKGSVITLITFMAVPALIFMVKIAVMESNLKQLDSNITKLENKIENSIAKLDNKIENSITKLDNKIDAKFDSIINLFSNRIIEQSEKIGKLEAQQRAR